jgi:ATP synthase protein I
MADGNRLSTVAKILFLQILTAILIASGFFFVGGWDDALSPMLGGLAALLPNLYFAFRATRAAASDPQGIVRAFYAGESGKLILTAVLFYLIFQLPGIKFLPLLAAYAAVLSTFWFALILRSD